MRLIVTTPDELNELSVAPHEPVREAMNRMNLSGRTCVVVAADDGTLAGVVSDGDARRFLSAGGSIDSPVKAAMNPSPTTLPRSTPPNEVRSFMVRRGFDFMPVLDQDRLAQLFLLEHSPRATDMSAVVMVGGLGTRLAPLTDNCPKPLLPLGPKPILSHILEHLISQGIHRFSFSVNYLAQMIVDHYDDGSDFDCFIDYVYENTRMGTGGSLSLIDTETLSDPFLCLNGDLLNDVDIGALKSLHVSREWEATMAVIRRRHTIQYGVVDTGEDGTFQRIDEKPVQSYLVNAGIYMLSKSVLDCVPSGVEYDMPTLFDDLRKRGRACGTYHHTGRWIDIGTTSEYQRAQAIFDDTESR